MSMSKKDRRSQVRTDLHRLLRRVWDPARLQGGHQMCSPGLPITAGGRAMSGRCFGPCCHTLSSACFGSGRSIGSQTVSVVRGWGVRPTGLLAL